MATIPLYVAQGTHVGQVQTVKARKVIWFSVGKGNVSEITDSEVAIAGRIDFLGYKDTLDIHLRLLDDEPAAKAGNCLLQINQFRDEAATYTANGKELIVSATLNGQRQGIALSPCNDGTQTQCRLFGHVQQTVHLDPN